MKKAIFITVRTGSTRLPKKCLLKIQGLTTIQHLIRRVKKSKLADMIILCTTELKEDDVLYRIAEKEKIKCFRGSVPDKLERWRGAAEKFGVEFFVTVDGDDIFCEPVLIDLAFLQCMKKKPDFIYGDGVKGVDVPCGAFTYAIKTKALKKVCEIKDTDDTEMMWIYFKNTGLFNCQKLEGVPLSYKRPEIRMTLDYPEDFKFFKNVIENLSKEKKEFDLKDIINYLDRHPEVVKINQNLQNKFRNNQKQKTKLILKNNFKNMKKEIQPSKYNGNELKYLKEALEADTGKVEVPVNWNKRLEKMFADRFGVKYAIAHNSGTSALHSCLSAAGVGPGDEVISPALTVIMDTFAILYQNAVPIYADVDPETFNIDPKDIERKITPRTKAILTVSFYGLSPDMDPIMEIAKKHNLVVIEDNAECYLGTYKGRLAGTIGHMSIFSFETSKHLSTGEGGIVITNNKEFAEKIRKCGGIGYKALEAGAGDAILDESILQSPDYKRHDYLGWNYRMPEFCAAIAVAQMEQLDEKVNKRRKIAEYFNEAIKGYSWMIPQKTPEGYTHSYWTYVVRYEGEKEAGIPWKEFYRTYKEMGGDGFYACWSLPYFEPVVANRKFYGKGCPVECPHYSGPKVEYKKGLCPVAESLQPKLMQFKTNYRDLGLAKRKAEALRKTIDYFER